MSRILDAALDAARRDQCIANDHRIAAGQPIRASEQPRAPRRVALSRTTVFHARAAVVKMCLCCLVLGFAAGQLVVPTDRPMPRMQMNKDDVRKVPNGPTPPRNEQRVVV